LKGEVMEEQSKAYREAYFDEMSDKNKIEFLAKELRRTQRELAISSKLLNKLSSHSHCDGKVVVELSRQSLVDEEYVGFRQSHQLVEKERS